MLFLPAMKYYSLNRQSAITDFKEATIKGQAPDGGLYFPSSVPAVDKDFIKNINRYSKEEIGFTIMKPYVGNAIPHNVLQRIVDETIDFDFPLVQINNDVYTLELFHGPTLAFKDVGARFMSRCLGYFNHNEDKHTTVLVATSGDTGGAVANGFHNVEGVDVIILYPSGKVSPVQELQLTTNGNNITALEVHGNFDDCQAMVKAAFADADLNKKLSLTSANSINVARWLPQQLYYFFAYQQWQEVNAPVICVPSGNFGNICAGMLAHVSGLPVDHFIAACNANDVISSYLETGSYLPKTKATATISNAMDVGSPSNFIRVLELFEQKYESIRTKLSGYTVDDATTEETIRKVYDEHDYTLDPHGAVGYYALSHYLKNNVDKKGFFLETAHPVKFPDTVEKAINKKLDIPENVQHLFNLQKQSIEMHNTFDAFKEWMMNR